MAANVGGDMANETKRRAKNQAQITVGLSIAGLLSSLLCVCSGALADPADSSDPGKTQATESDGQKGKEGKERQLKPDY